jgi:hypothetical protein
LQNPAEVLNPVQLERLEQARSSSSTVILRDESEIGTGPGGGASEGEMQTWHFKAERVRTFAWTSSDATIWDAASIDWGDGSGTLVQSVYPREVRAAWSESTQMLRHSIAHYSEQWFRYPYPSAANVHGVCGGMEYPMIIFCGGRSKRGLHSVTSHEIGHTWFPMVVNSDERRHAWMDEGFNTFINGYDRFEDYTATVTGEAREARGPRGSRRGRRSRSGLSQPIAMPADQIRPNLLGRLQYAKTASGLRLLRERILGPDRFDPAFRLYIRSWAFKSPQPSDFYRCMENAAGMNLAWFWRGWFHEDVLFDQAIVSVKSAEDSQTALIQLANVQEMVMPVWMQVDFANGTTQQIDLPVYVWYYTNLWTTEVPTQGKEITRVVIDSAGDLPDADRANNRWQKSEALPPDGAESGSG